MKSLRKGGWVWAKNSIFKIEKSSLAVRPCKMAKSSYCTVKEKAAHIGRGFLLDRSWCGRENLSSDPMNPMQMHQPDWASSRGQWVISQEALFILNDAQFFQVLH